MESNIMLEIIQFNRKTLKTVDNWINKEDWNLGNSVFNYGLPETIYHLINSPINEEITEADMICNYLIELSRITNKINYLEIGVSVGKTFYQIINFQKYFLNNLNQKSFSCIDIEKINPILEKILDNDYNNLKEKNETNKDETLTNSIHKFKNNTITKWDNMIVYYEADEFDKNIWKNMINKYNFIFSDALHEPEALIKEYENLKTNNLLDETGFIYCFDDLESERDKPMWSAVNKIYIDIVNNNPLLNVKIEHFIVNGWIGQYEHAHNFGVIKAL